ncbi:MAG TPA: LysR family transcriptional regulator [Pararobbsia sp.]|jgi:DNA-binding transcriptional LysR family regulator|nr:LysR family transcriptional regulator [Pararobbsia sp.]
MATDRLGDMRLFVDAATLGSLSAAGRKVGLSPAAASARLLKLESALKARLFERTTRKLRLTDEGRLYLQHCRVALQAIDDAEAALQEGQNAIRGKVRISATSDFGRNLLRDWLNVFSARHPDVSFALTLSDSVVNLLEGEIDLAIRYGVPRDGTLIARRLAPNRRVLCASPSYLAKHGEPQHVTDLADHRFVVVVNSTGPLNTYLFMTDNGPYTHTVPVDHAWETNDGALAREWVLAGHGIAHHSIWDIAADVRAGSLKVLLPACGVDDAGVHAVYHGNQYRAPRVRALLDFLIDQFEQATDELLGDIFKATTPHRQRPTRYG